MSAFGGGREDWESPGTADRRVNSLLDGVLAILAVLLVISVAYGQDAPRVIPDPAITPGLVASADQALVCANGGGGSTYSETHRLSQNEETKKLVMSRYGVPWSDRARYEDDHLVPLCAGGSDDVANRWPQPRVGDWTSAMKDQLEALACRKVCHTHEVPLAEAQAWFLAPADWRTAYCAQIRGAPRQ